MRTRGPGIAPWSFYKTDPLDNLIDIDSSEPYSTIDNPNHHKKDKRDRDQSDAKDYDKINKEKIETLLQQKKHKKDKKVVNTINGYCPIVSTSLELLETRDRIIALNQKYLVIVAIRETLKSQFREKETKVMREKFQCLFPLLKPKQQLSTQKKRGSVRTQSQLFLNSCRNHNSTQFS